jgi:hypothetical protein
MFDQRSSTESEAHAFLDRAILGLLLDDDKQRPWSEVEIAREISTPGHVPASLKRLRTGGLVHRWNDLVTATRSAVRFHEITQSGDPASAEERRHDKAVLESLLARATEGQRQSPRTSYTRPSAPRRHSRSSSPSPTRWTASTQPASSNGAAAEPSPPRSLPTSIA